MILMRKEKLRNGGNEMSPRGWLVPPEFRTGIMIRNILLREGKASPYNVWKEIEEKSEKAGYVPPTYISIATLFWILQDLGLIEFVGKIPPKRKGYLKKALFRVVPGKEDAWEWENPRLAKYNPKKFWETRTTKYPLVTYTIPPTLEMIETRNLREILARAREKRFERKKI